MRPPAPTDLIGTVRDHRERIRRLELRSPTGGGGPFWMERTFVVGGLLTAGMVVPVAHIAVAPGETKELVRVQTSFGSGSADLSWETGNSGTFQATSGNNVYSLTPALALVDTDYVRIAVTAPAPGTADLSATFVVRVTPAG